MFYDTDELIKNLTAQAEDLESIDPTSQEAEALRVAVDLIKRAVVPRLEGARVLPIGTVQPGWELLWLQLKGLPDGGRVVCTGVKDKVWKLEAGSSKFLLSGDGYNKNWRVWDRPPTGRDQAEWPWETEEYIDEPEI